jgi:hypothetical protein
MMARGRAIFTPGKYLEDPLHPGYVLRFIDWNDPTHYLEQTDTTKQVALPTAHADFAGSLSAHFTGVEYYVSSRGAGEWTYRHNGISHEEYIILTPLMASGVGGLHDTSNPATGTDSGVYTYFSGTASNWRVAILNAAGTVAIHTGNTVTNGTPTYLGLRSSGDGTQAGSTFTKYVKSAPTAMSTSAAPMAGAPGATLTLGRRVATNQLATMRWAGSFFFPALSAVERAQFQAYVTQSTGIAA